MTIVVQQVLPFGTARTARGGLPYAFRQDQPPQLVVISHAYRLRSDPARVRLVPEPAPVGSDGLPLPQTVDRRPLVLYPEPLQTRDGTFDAAAVSWPSPTVQDRVAALAPGQTATSGRPRPYRLTDIELAEFDGAVLRLDVHDFDGQW